MCPDSSGFSHHDKKQNSSLSMFENTHIQSWLWGGEWYFNKAFCLFVTLQSKMSFNVFSHFFLYQVSLCLLFHLQVTVSGILTLTTTGFSRIQCPALKICLWVVCWSSAQVPLKNLSFHFWNTMKRSNCAFQWALKAQSWQMLIFMT
jgi:hypothetical protein